MPELKDRKRPTKRGYKREYVLTKSEERFLRQVGARIMDIASKEGKSLEGLAFKTGLSRAAIYNLVNGRHNFKILTIVSIANELGVNYHDLLP